MPETRNKSISGYKRHGHYSHTGKLRLLLAAGSPNSLPPQRSLPSYLNKSIKAFPGRKGTTFRRTPATMPACYCKHYKTPPGCSLSMYTAACMLWGREEEEKRLTPGLMLLLFGPAPGHILLPPSISLPFERGTRRQELNNTFLPCMTVDREQGLLTCNNETVAACLEGKPLPPA